MKITFRELQTNTKWMDNLPVEIVRYGIVVAKIVSPNSSDDRQVDLWKKRVEELELEIKELKDKGVPTVSPVLPPTNTIGIGRDPAEFLASLGKKTEEFHKCQWPKGYCGVMDTLLSDYGEWLPELGETKKTQLWLCKKHASLAKRNLEAFIA